mmetsp:Transcript_15322/g.20557  ORF Transcript_15322/g.20557 Transcript_15322/m.20557 type:complete len:255 (-) Transcript_15322:402-1166(-)
MPGLNDIANEDDRFKYDISMRADDVNEKSSCYTTMPISAFGEAALRGMGWKGKIDKDDKTDVNEPRHHRLGLGATPKPPSPKSKKKNDAGNQGRSPRARINCRQTGRDRQLKSLPNRSLELRTKSGCGLHATRRKRAACSGSVMAGTKWKSDLRALERLSSFRGRMPSYSHSQAAEKKTMRKMRRERKGGGETRKSQRRRCSTVWWQRRGSSLTFESASSPKERTIDARAPSVIRIKSAGCKRLWSAWTTGEDP